MQLPELANVDFKKTELISAGDSPILEIDRQTENCLSLHQMPDFNVCLRETGCYEPSRLSRGRRGDAANEAWL